MPDERRTLAPPPGLVLAAIRKLAGDGTTGMVEKVGRRDPFLVLVSTVLSLRTKDEMTEVRSRALFRKARTPQAMIRLGAERIAEVIYPVGFYRRKAEQIVAISRLLLDVHGGRVPEDIETLLTLPGVGRKTANLVRSAGHGKPAICVDTHVHRICNRLGWARTRHPDETEMVLRRDLHRRYWMRINSLMVFFGKTTCQPVSPLCSGCPLAEPCPRIGVTRCR